MSGRLSVTRRLGRSDRLSVLEQFKTKFESDTVRYVVHNEMYVLKIT